MEQFKRETSGFNYVWEGEFVGIGGETYIVEMPHVSHNKKSVADIAWQTNGNINLYATIASNPEGEDTIWQQINEGEEINGAVTALMVQEPLEDYSDHCKVIIRVIMR